MLAVILAGGKGTRLWPMSREARPKQFFDVIGNKTLIDDAYARLRRLFPADGVFVAATPELAPLVRACLPGLPADQLILEPSRRDTAPAMGYVAAVLAERFADEALVFVPSDHYIADESRFLRCLQVGGRLVAETGRLVDIGVPPTFPNTALGYTKIGALIGAYDGIRAHAFAGHTEKPSRAVAELYLKDRAYLWHANYYTWTPRRFLAALDRHAPELGSSLREIAAAPADERAARFAALPAVSFDYAVTEHLAPEDVIILRGDFGWSDIGSWDTLYDRLADEEGKNVTKGSVVTIDARGVLAYVPRGKAAAVIGVDDVVVIDTEDALLVCRRDQAQRVKEAVARLREEGLHAHL